MKNTLGIEVCSCEQATFYCDALRYIKQVTVAETSDQWEDLRRIQKCALDTLATRNPGGEGPCSCDEALHLAKALRACANVAAFGTGGKVAAPIHDVAQCANFAHQGLTLSVIEGDPGVYDCQKFIPGTIENGRWSLEGK